MVLLGPWIQLAAKELDEQGDLNQCDWVGILVFLLLSCEVGKSLCFFIYDVIPLVSSVFLRISVKVKEQIGHCVYNSP